MGNRVSNIRIEKINLLTDEISSRLQDLFDDLEHRHPQFGLEWLKILSRYARDSDDSACIFVADNSSGFAALPLIISRGQEGRALGNFYTSLAEPATSTTEPTALLTALLSHLRIDEGLSTLTLSPLDRKSAIYTPLLRAFQEAGWSGVHEFFCFGNWLYSVHGETWESYLKERPSRLRNTIDRKTRAFMRDGKGQLNVLSGGDKLAAAIEAYTSIYEHSWKRNEPHPEFIPQLIELAARKGWLRLGVATYEDKAIAGQIWLVADGTAYIFKLAYHPDFAHLSPGTLLTAHLMQHVMEQDGVGTVDYLSGDDAYKKDWMSTRRERYGIAGYNNKSLRGAAQLVVQKLSAFARRLGLRKKRGDL